MYYIKEHETSREKLKYHQTFFKGKEVKVLKPSILWKWIKKQFCFDVEILLRVKNHLSISSLLLMKMFEFDILKFYVCAYGCLFSNRVIMNRNRIEMQFHQIYLPFFTLNLGTRLISGYLKLSETSFNSDIATFICAMC